MENQRSKEGLPIYPSIPTSKGDMTSAGLDAAIVELTRMQKLSGKDGYRITLKPEYPDFIYHLDNLYKESSK